jgi:hypothetical protein
MRSSTGAVRPRSAGGESIAAQLAGAGCLGWHAAPTAAVEPPIHRATSGATRSLANSKSAKAGCICATHLPRRPSRNPRFARGSPRVLRDRRFSPVRCRSLRRKGAAWLPPPSTLPLHRSASAPGTHPEVDRRLVELRHAPVSPLGAWLPGAQRVATRPGSPRRASAQPDSNRSPINNKTARPCAPAGIVSSLKIVRWILRQGPFVPTPCWRPYRGPTPYGQPPAS